MSTRGRSTSPQTRDMDVDMDKPSDSKPEPKVVVITNLTRNVVEAHLRGIFGFYGEVIKIDLPTYAKSGQNKGKAALEYANASSARTAVSHMNGGQLDGAALKVELSDAPVFHRTRSRSPPLRQQQQQQHQRNGRDRDRDRAPRSLSRPRSRSPPPARFQRRGERDFNSRTYATGDSYRRAPPASAPLRRPPPPGRDVYRPRSRTRSRSPIRRPGGALGTRRRSPSYERGGYGRRGRSRSYSSSVRSSRSGSRTPSRSRSRSRSRSFSRSRSRSRTRSRSLSPSYSSWSRGRSRSRSYSRGRRSYSRDDIRDSRSRSAPPKDV